MKDEEDDDGSWPFQPVNRPGQGARPERKTTPEDEGKGDEIYPDVRSAFTLTFMAMMATLFVGVSFSAFGTLTAVGIGHALGIGAVATLAARRVAEPQADRLGLRAMDLQALPMLLCLVPAILLASELDNIAHDFMSDGSSATGSEILRDYDAIEDTLANEGLSDGNESAEGGEGGDLAAEEPLPPLIDPSSPLSVWQALIIFVGIKPVVEEFLFRGVIQQGLVERLGMVRGISVVALLWTLLQPAAVTDLGRFLVTAVASFALGWLLSLVRMATGSILGSMLLASSWGAIGLVSITLQGSVDLPGLNVEGSHLPLVVLLACIGLVAWSSYHFFIAAQNRVDRGIGSPTESAKIGDETNDDWPSD